ncbi:hypothetical protein BGW36DRAFT_353433 [Talaromyces proteolyticus]|uniref:Uncharacterized protein n=1 Tax=Talaromyces proteolyticus TaxID=1131652 RepID=A0AAD4L6S9_9EURO|nr:uncharacterized protein BGW36DRAFT_353433 [Talaromyces proteolyticus]KAH8705004.1 hypothetical protein BGW36DRAFT_353433 [Talaromyces proteolyticus]
MSIRQLVSKQSMVLAQFPLAKYSYVETLVNQHESPNWTHSHSSDLTIIIEKEEPSPSAINFMQPKLRLRVVRAQENLEDLDLNFLAREATQQAIEKQTRNIKPLVAIIVKDPCLAVRYPFGKDQMRRFQLKFCSSQDWSDTLNILREINCYYSESSTEHPSRSASIRPDSSSSRIMTPVTSFSSINSDWRQRASSPASLPSHRFIDTSTATIPDETIKDMTGERTSTQAAERPITAPAYDSQALDKELPPKRDLPFSRPGTRLSHTLNRQPATRFSRPSETSSNTQQNPTPSGFEMTTASPRPHTAQSTQVLATSSPARQLRLELEDKQWGTNQEQKPSPLAVNASSLLLDTSIFQPFNPINNKPHAKGPPAASCIGSPPTLDTSPTSHQQPVTGQEASNITKPPHVTPLLSTDLSSFLTTPESERSALVSNWICQQLEDDGFRALCQDVERVWQRIALGS